MPHGGRFIGSLISTLIPDQRIDRLESYVTILASKLEGIGEDQERLIAASPEHVDLFEEGAFRAARALSEQRIRHFALIVAIGMTKGTAEAIAQKRLLTLLSDLDEQDIVTLNWHVLKNRVEGGPYAENHPELLMPQWPPATVWSAREVRESEALRQAINSKLIRYGLVDLVDDRVPEGMTPRKREKISQLGLLLLRTVGLSENESAAY